MIVMSSFYNQYVKRALFAATVGIVIAGLSACGRLGNVRKPAGVVRWSSPIRLSTFVCG